MITKTTTVLTVLLVVMCIAANAQEKGDFAVGGYFAIGTYRNYSDGGIGARLLYNPSDRIRLAAEADTWRQPGKLYNINVYAHFFGRNANNKRVAVYPFIGFGRETKKPPSIITADSIKRTIVSNNTAFLLGLGLDYKLTSNLAINTELRFHQLRLWERTTYAHSSANLAVGVAYKF